MVRFGSWALVGALVLWAPVVARAQVNAGDDVTLECAGPDGAEYTLNGSAPDGEGFSFEWSSDPNVPLADADTLTPTGTFGIGETLVTLTSTAPDGSTESDSVVVTVADLTAPVAHAKADPFILWPPDHRLHEVMVDIRARDACTPRDDLDVVLVAAEASEADNGKGDGNTQGDIQDADIGTDDRSVLLRAERSGGGHGRVYILTYSVTDAAGNSTEVDAKVIVPHDASDLKHPKDKDGEDDGSGGDDARFAPICPAPVDAVDSFTDAFPDLAATGSEKDCMRACRVWTQGCRGIVGGTSQCLRSEGRSRVLLRALECRQMDDRQQARDCKTALKAFARRAGAWLREQTDTAGQTCLNRGHRCANACGDVFGAP